MKYLSNAFSLQMLSGDSLISTAEIQPEEISREDFLSVIGHADTANVLSGILNRDVPCNRQNVTLKAGDVLYVAQLTGGRLPEGSKNLPEGFSFKFIKVTLMD